MRSKLREWSYRWNGFPDWATPTLAAITLLVVVFRDQGYVTMALLLFFCIYIELYQIRKRLGTMKVELTLPKKEEPDVYSAD